MKGEFNMSSTNKTTNYKLSQFVGTDVPSYLGDYNSDMSKIDKAIGDVANSQGSVEQSVVGLTADVQGLSTQVSGVATSVQQVQTSVAQIDTAYKQADTALSQRITANANNIQANTTAIENANTAIESANTAIESINTAIGVADISEIGDGTIKGAISNINSSLSNFKSKTKHYTFQVNNVNLSNQFGSVYGIDVPFQFGETISLNIADLSCSYVPSDNKSCYADITALTNEAIVFGLTRPTTDTVNGTIYLRITEK